MHICFTGTPDGFQHKLVGNEIHNFDDLSCKPLISHVSKISFNSREKIISVRTFKIGADVRIAYNYFVPARTSVNSRGGEYFGLSILTEKALPVAEISGAAFELLSDAFKLIAEENIFNKNLSEIAIENNTNYLKLLHINEQCQLSSVSLKIPNFDSVNFLHVASESWLSEIDNYLLSTSALSLGKYCIFTTSENTYSKAKTNFPQTTSFIEMGFQKHSSNNLKKPLVNKTPPLPPSTNAPTEDKSNDLSNGSNEITNETPLNYLNDTNNPKYANKSKFGVLDLVLSSAMFFIIGALATYFSNSYLLNKKTKDSTSEEITDLRLKLKEQTTKIDGLQNALGHFYKSPQLW